MERRVFLAILLSFVVFYGYQAIFLPPPPPVDRSATENRVAGTPSPDASVPVTAPSPPEPAVVSLISAASEREIVVETRTVRAVLSNRGARILSWRLKGYGGDRGEAVDLVPSGLSADQPRPFSLQVDDSALTQRMNGALYRVAGDTDGRLDARAAAGTLAFEYQDAAGLHVRKTFRFDPAGYVVSFSATVSRGTETLNPTILWGPGLGDAGATTGGGSFFTGNYVQPPQAILHREGDVDRLALSAIAEQPVYEGEFRFAGTDDHYFLAAAVNPGQARLEFRPVTIPGPGGTQRQFVAQAIRLKTPPQDVRFFVGPKQIDILRSVDAEMVRAIYFGMFDWVVVPLLSSLKWVYGYVGNYGFSIIVLTILINLALFPLRHKSVVSMRKMQQLQPQMKAIQDRYANLKMTDPGRQKMNAEVMNLYKEKGVNPAAGCVPMLLTMPVLLAFYSLLSMSIELRGAPFGAWIQDLSKADPFYVIPALMGVTMFWQQRITPTSMDPTQQKVMMIMPFMFTGMMLFSPSGVVLYWFVSNLWAIGQQYFTNWLIGPAPIAAARAPAERRLKNAGGGKSSGAQNP